MNITFYIVSDDSRVISKNLSNGVVLNCNIRSDIDLYNPILLIKEWNNDYNYFSWDNKYYFVRGVEYVYKGVYRVSSHIDVLMSYKTLILNSEVKISSGSEINSFYDGGDYDNLVKYEVERYYSNKTIDNLDNTILVTIGNRGV